MQQKCRAWLILFWFTIFIIIHKHTANKAPTKIRYAVVCLLIESFKRNRAQLSYSRLGLILCFLHIPFHSEKHYFCSQFVVEMLKQSGAVSLERRPELYLPNHFLWELRGSSQVVGMQVNPI